MRKNTFDIIFKRFVPILMLFFSCASVLESFPVKCMCIGVGDGDTIVVLINNEKTRIKIDGIECPELGQDFGKKAKQFTMDLVFNKVVEVNIKSTTNNNVLVAYILIEHSDVGLELLKAGLAWNYNQGKSSDTAYIVAEQDARNGKIGLWSMPNPMPPWEFRKIALSLLDIKPSKPSTDEVPPAKTNLDTKQEIAKNSPIEIQETRVESQLTFSEEKRQKGLELFEAIIRGLLPKVEEMHVQYTRYSESCFGWRSREVECLKMWSDYLRLKKDIKDAIVRATERGRTSGVYPGQMREVLQLYSLSGSEWD